MTFHVGIAGHREIPPGVEDDLEQRLLEVLAACREQVRDVAAQSRTLHATGEPVTRMVSSLAEGADRLAARAALELGYALLCPLPFGREEYAQDFRGEANRTEFEELLERAESVLELDGHRDAADEFYLAAGRLLLNHSDLLIAVWDGGAARGRGGTAQIVDDAVRHGIAVIWVDARAPHEIRCLRGAGTQDYRVLLRERVEAILDAPRSPGRRVTGAQSYFGETRRRWRPVFLYRLFVNVLLLRWRRPPHLGRGFEQSAVAEWDRAWEEDAEAAARFEPQVGRHFRSHFVWADSLALHYAHLYRTSYLLRYVFGIVAVLGVMVGFYGSADISHYGFLAQAVFLAIVIVISRLAVRGRWNERSIDYRLFAELMRNMRYLYPLGRVSPVLRAPAHDPLNDVSWVNWHYRGVVREAGLFDGRIDGGFLRVYRRFLEQGELAGMRSFYVASARDQGRLARRLERLGMLLFYLGLVAIVVRVAMQVFGHLAGDPDDLSRLAHQLSFFLPALAPALFGLASQGQYARLSQRYEAMARLLQGIQGRIGELDDLSSKDLGVFAEDAALRITDEVSDWGVLVRARVLSPF